MKPPKNWSLIVTNMTPENSSTSISTSSAKPRARRRSQCSSANAITRPAATNCSPSQGSTPIANAAAATQRIRGRSRTISAISDAPTSNAPAVISGVTVVE